MEVDCADRRALLAVEKALCFRLVVAVVTGVQTLKLRNEVGGLQKSSVALSHNSRPVRLAQMGNLSCKGMPRAVRAPPAAGAQCQCQPASKTTLVPAFNLWIYSPRGRTQHHRYSTPNHLLNRGGLPAQTSLMHTLVVWLHSI